MVEIISLRSGILRLPKVWLEQVGLEEDGNVVVESQGTQLIIKPLSAQGLAKERLLQHLSLPIGALKGQAVNPDKSIIIKDEFEGDPYDNID